MNIVAVDVILLIVMFLFALADVPLALDKVHGNTWSERINAWNVGTFPMVGFCVMFLAGHWALPTLFHMKHSFLISMIVLIANCIVIQVVRYIIKKPFNKIGLSINSLMGLLQGWLLWGV